MTEIDAFGSMGVRDAATPYLVAKRALDLTLGTVALLVSLPIMAIALVAIRLDSPGPALFRQTRIGHRGRSFTMYKLRTMRTGSDTAHRWFIRQLLRSEAPSRAPGGMYKLENDARITRIGRVLRRTSVDELPQLWNVIRGDMTLVGPRPALPWEVELYRPHHLSRLDVKPGITGLWQTSGRCELTMAEALDLDVKYAAQRCMGMDLKILLRTVPAVLSRRGAA